jgi:cell division transport system ATP-binding protein
MIRLQDVTKVYEGGTVAVRDATLDVPKGEFVFLVGPSGSGKSTLIRLMLRQDDVTRGSIWVAGKDVTKMPSWKVPFLRRSIGTVFQDFKLLPNKNVAENVAFALEVLGRPRSVIKRQVGQVLDLVGLDGKEDRKPKQLSGGEQQRVSIARAFVNRPPIMLADEPTGNLDPATSVGIMRLLDRINRTGTTIVMATHDHAIVDAMRRRVVQLEAGRIVRDQSGGRYEHVQDEVPQEPVVGEVMDTPADTDMPLAAAGEAQPDDSVELDMTETVDGDAPESES